MYNHLNSNFTVTCVSSNTNLVNVSVGGAGASPALTFTPVANQNGSTSIGVTAVSGSLTNSTNLTLTVTPVNQPPSFTLALNSYTVDQYDMAVSVAHAVTGISPGPANESAQTVSFVVTNSSPNLFQVAPSIDASGALAFTPAHAGGIVTVGIQAIDNGGTANGGVNTSAVQTMSIIIPSNSFQSVAGSFAGLFYDTNTLNNASSGYFSLVLATNGDFSGYVLGAGNSNAFSGQFDISNHYASVTASSYTLDLILDTGVNETISGSVSNSASGWDVPLQSYHAGYSASSHTSLAGNYLMAMPGFEDPAAGPAGDSIFTIDINAAGAVMMIAIMADGSFVTQNSQISHAGYYPLYAPIYRSGMLGSLFGWLDFTGGVSDPLSANSILTWFNLSGATTLYPGGFTNQAVPAASLYTSNLVNLLPFTSGSIVLSGGNLQENLTNNVTIRNNVITATSPTNRLSVAVDSSSGIILGSFVDPNSNLTNDFYAVILQNTNICPGYFLGASQGGSFILTGN